MNMEVLVGGIPVRAHHSMEEAVESIFSIEDGGVQPGFAVAVNPEKIMKARVDPKVMDTLMSATFRFADGIGVVWLLRRKGAPWANRVPGCDLWTQLMLRAAQLQQSVFLVGATPHVLNVVRTKLVETYSARVVGYQDGYFSIEHQDELIQRIKDSQARIVTVALGSPRQELFIDRCRQIYPDAFYMGVGGTYDVFAGHVKRAPQWACNMNLEWFYRLAANPSRIGRQLVLVRFLALGLLRRL